MNATKKKSTSGLVRFVIGAVLGAGIGGCAYFLFIESLIDDVEHSTVVRSQKSTDGLSIEDNESETVQSFEELLYDQDLVNFVQYINELDHEGLIDLLAQSTEFTADRRTLSLQKFLLGKLARENPQFATDEIWKLPSSRWDELLVLVFSEWSTIDFEQALQAASTFTGWVRETSIRAIVAERDDVSTETMLNVAQSLGLESVVAAYIQEVRVMELSHAPEAAWNLVVSDNVPEARQTELLTRIAGDWQEVVGFEILDILFDSLYHIDRIAFEQSLNSVISSNFNAAFDFMTSMSIEKQKAITPILLGQWAKENPEHALQSTSRVEHGTTRNLATSNVMYGWAEKNPSTLLESVELFPRMMRRTAVGIAVPRLARSDPASAAEHLGRLIPIVGTIDLHTEFSLIEEWSKKDVRAAKRWVDEHAAESDSRRSRLMQRMLTQYALADAEEALKLALAEEVNEADPSGAEVHVIGALVASGKTDAALNLLPHVRESARLSSTIRIATGFLGSDQGDKAVELAQRLPVAERTEFFKNLAQRWFEIDLEELLVRISSFPTDGTRAVVAKDVLARAEFTTGTKLTEKQRTLLTTFLASSGSN